MEIERKEVSKLEVGDLIPEGDKLMTVVYVGKDESGNAVIGLRPYGNLIQMWGMTSVAVLKKEKPLLLK